VRAAVFAMAGCALTSCEVDASLRRARDAQRSTDVAEASVDPLDDPFARAEPRELPSGEPREARCDGQDDDGDGRVDEGWVYEERGCDGGCDAPPSSAGPRPLYTLAVAFNGTRGAVIWREGFIQPDNGIPYVEVSWDGRFFTAEGSGLVEAPRVAAGSPAQPARAGSLAWVAGRPVALWGYSAVSCERTRSCTNYVSPLVDRRRDASVAPQALPSPYPRGSGLVGAGDHAFALVVGETEGFDLFAYSTEAMSLRRVAHTTIDVAADHIGVVRGDLWSDTELVWVYEHTEPGRALRLNAFWTDHDGGVTSPPVEVVQESHLDPTTSSQVSVHEGVLLVTHLVNGRGFFLTRYDRAAARSDSVLLTRSAGRYRAAWDGSTLYVCTGVLDADSMYQVQVQRFSALGEELSAPSRVSGSLPDCAIAAHAGVALLGMGVFRIGGTGKVVGLACPAGAPP
jgi:hypothetical protein